MTMMGFFSAERAMGAATRRAGASKATRHILTAVLAWSLMALTASGGALVYLVARGKVDMASGTTLGGLFTIFSGLALFVLKALVGGVKLSEAPEESETAPATEPPRSGGESG